jgi:uncharacterized membrane protein
MIVMSALIHLERRLLVLVAFVLLAGHNLLDRVHVPGSGLSAFLWALLHEPGRFEFGRTVVHVHYPILPWIGIMALGYCAGPWFDAPCPPRTRRKHLLRAGILCTGLFVLLRAGNFYGDPTPWSPQVSGLFSLSSFLNVTKYPPSLLYTSITLGPALLGLTLVEGRGRRPARRIVTFGRVPLFFYMAHTLLIHVLATIAAVATGFSVTDMILSSSVNAAPALKGYGFGLPTVYLVWVGVLLALYPGCQWFAAYKRSHQASRWWLSYL